MQHMSVEKRSNAIFVENLRINIAKMGRWHLKRRRADSTRIWKRLFKNIKEILEEKYPFSERAFIRLVVYPNQNKYSFVIHRHNRTCYNAYIAKSEENYEKIITVLNSVLIHYNLILSETVESQKNHFYHAINGHIEYELKFVQNN